MSQSNLVELTYFDPKSEVRLTTYADTIIIDSDGKGNTLSAVRFGGYPEMVRGMADAIYGGATVEAIQNGTTISLRSRPKSYQRQLSHDGLYATATLMSSDDIQEADTSEESEEDENSAADEAAKPAQPRKCYIFSPQGGCDIRKAAKPPTAVQCPGGDRDRLFEELNRKTAAPLIPEFRDCVLDALIDRGELRPLKVFSIKERLDAQTHQGAGFPAPGCFLSSFSCKKRKRKELLYSLR